MTAVSRALMCGLALALVGCANPLNRVTYERYAESCERGVEEACYRAWVNTRIGMLGPELESRALYNWGAMLTRTKQYAKAEEPLSASLALEDKLEKRSDERIGRRLAELAIATGQQGKIEAGLQYMDRLLPLAMRFEGHERLIVAGLCMLYADELRKQGNLDRAKTYEAKVAQLGLDIEKLRRGEL